MRPLHCRPPKNGTRRSSRSTSISFPRPASRPSAITSAFLDSQHEYTFNLDHHLPCIDIRYVTFLTEKSLNYHPRTDIKIPPQNPSSPRRFNTTNSPYEATLEANSTVEEQGDDASIPTQNFNFISIAQISGVQAVRFLPLFSYVFS